MSHLLTAQAKFLARRYEPLDMSHVLDILFLLGCDQDKVYFKKMKQSVCDVCCWCSSQEHAKNIKRIWFFGGPPKREGWFEGSLYQFIIDRLMRGIIIDGIPKVLQKLNLSKKKHPTEEEIEQETAERYAG